MDCTTLEGFEQVRQGSLVIDPASLYCAFEKVKDGRKAKGKRYPLAFLLTLIMLGKLAGQTTPSGIVSWINERRALLKKLLSWPKSFPVKSTYSDALSTCDAQEIGLVIAQVFLKARAEEVCADEPSRLLVHQQEAERLIHTPMDGKTLRGTLGHEHPEQPPVHLLSLYEQESGIVIAQVVVNSKENEITAAKELLKPLYVKGRIISADALHMQKGFCAGVHVYGGKYLITIKENQPSVLQDIHDFFEDSSLDQGEWEYHKDVQKGHGRLEVREIWASTQMNAWFQETWAGFAQCFRIKRTITTRKKVREEIAYGCTNLSRKEAHAERLLQLNRNHWCVENRLHYRRDVTLGEDACQVRTKHVPQVFAAINGGILTLLDWLGVTNAADHLRHLCAHPQEIVHLLFHKLSR